MPNAPLWVVFLTYPSSPPHRFVFLSSFQAKTLVGRPSLRDVCSLSCLDTCKWSKPLPFASRDIKGTLSLTFSSPFFELLLCYSKFLPSSCCLPHYIHSSFSWGFGATSCPIFSYYWMNKESFGGYLGSLRLVKWSWSHEVILFFTLCIVLLACNP
jgi:hypothetical protein